MDLFCFSFLLYFKILKISLLMNMRVIPIANSNFFIFLLRHSLVLYCIAAHSFVVLFNTFCHRNGPLFILSYEILFEYIFIFFRKLLLEISFRRFYFITFLLIYFGKSYREMKFSERNISQLLYNFLSIIICPRQSYFSHIDINFYLLFFVICILMLQFSIYCF